MFEPYVGWSYSFVSDKAPAIPKEIRSLLKPSNTLQTGQFYGGPSAGLRLGYRVFGLKFGTGWLSGKLEK